MRGCVCEVCVCERVRGGVVQFVKMAVILKLVRMII